MSRPRRDGETVASVLVSVRLTEDEAAAITAAAQAAGVSRSDFLRQAVGAATTGRRAPRRGGEAASGSVTDPALEEAIRGLAFQCRRIGKNVNQIARSAAIAGKSGGGIPPDLAIVMAAAQQELGSIGKTLRGLAEGGEL
jgi:hypothetical protein